MSIRSFQTLIITSCRPSHSSFGAPQKEILSNNVGPLTPRSRPYQQNVFAFEDSPDNISPFSIAARDFLSPCSQEMVSEDESQSDQIQHQPSAHAPTPLDQSNIEVYSVYKVWQKRTIILAAAVAGFFSPLSSTIYLPALTTLADAEHVSNSLINLTITSYLVSVN